MLARSAAREDNGRSPMTASRQSRAGARALAWTVCALTVAVALASLVLAIVDPNVGGPAHVSASGSTPQDEPEGGYVPYAAFSALVFSAFAVVGAIVAIRRPRNPVGWFFGAGALLWSLGVLSSGVYWHMAFGRANPPAAADYVAWFATWSFLPAFVLLLALVPLLFPTGAPPSPRWRKVGWTAAVAGVVATLSNALAPGSLEAADFPWVDNPFGVGGLGLDTLAAVSFPVVGVAAFAGIASLVVRYRRAHGVERQQLRWVAGAGCLLVLAAIGGSAASGWLGEGAGWLGILLGLLGVAVAVAIALLRYRLYDLDVVVNRTLVYAALTATLAATYLATVLVLQLLLSGTTGNSGLAVAASTIAVAGLFRPARARIQHVVDRRFYRRKYDAQRTVDNFSARLRDELDLAALSSDLRGVVRETLQPAHVTLWLREQP
jgi:cytochrome b subunit of formate dehydrogenase